MMLSSTSDSLTTSSAAQLVMASSAGSFPATPTAACSAALLSQRRSQAAPAWQGRGVSVRTTLPDYELMTKLVLIPANKRFLIFKTN